SSPLRPDEQVGAFRALEDSCSRFRITLSIVDGPRLPSSRLPEPDGEGVEPELIVVGQRIAVGHLRAIALSRWSEPRSVVLSESPECFGTNVGRVARIRSTSMDSPRGSAQSD